MVKWYKEDEKGQMDLLEKNVTILPNNSRIFTSGDLSQGDVSLIILNVTTSDHGIYFCEVTLPDGKVVTGDGTKLRIRRALGNTCSYLFFFLLVFPPKLVCTLAKREKLACLASGIKDLVSWTTAKKMLAALHILVWKTSYISAFLSPPGLFGIEESIGTIIGVVAAGIGGIVVLIVVLTPQLRKCILCMRQESHQRSDLNCDKEYQKVAAKCKLAMLIKICSAQSTPYL
ncbi:hypothetical protein RLOC_00011906 [Lonchura striata]|uniref:Ig-like domain-containing protein n=1 Tax=Lonchura striata TaxID=40157 RepID=A0A218VDA3_9PASE|nr:hypothetical protein RLOC_00011906 [Lonchura striata domestica]